MEFSISALTTYWDCPEKYRKLYISKEEKRGKQNDAMFLGSAVHAGINGLLNAKMSGTTNCLLDGLTACELYINKQIGDLELSPAAATVGIEGVKDGIKRSAFKIITIYNSSWMPKITPIASELWFKIPWKEDIIKGSIDLVEVNQGGSLAVVDHKISSNPKTPDADSAELSVQVKVYAIVYKALTGKTPEIGALDHFVPSPKRPHFLRREVLLTPASLRATEARIDRTIAAIKAGVFPPGNPVTHCKQSRCDFFSKCPMGGGA